MATQNASLSAQELKSAEILYRQAVLLRDEMVMPELQRQLSRAFSWYATSKGYAQLDEEERQHVSRYYMSIADLMDTIAAYIPEKPV